MESLLSMRSDHGVCGGYRISERGGGGGGGLV